MVFAGQLVKKQDQHALCSDPDMKNHKQIARQNPPGEVQFGFIDDAGNEVWL
jgi:hypothetical protein